jgi:hypothetical protein
VKTMEKKLLKVKEVEIEEKEIRVSKNIRT